MSQLASPPAAPDQPARRSVVPPAQFVANAVSMSPHDAPTLEEWAARLQVSVLTLEQDFRREFGVTYRELRVILQHSAAAALLGPHAGRVPAKAVGVPHPEVPLSPATPWSALSPQSPRTPW